MRLSFNGWLCRVVVASLVVSCLAFETFASAQVSPNQKCFDRNHDVCPLAGLLSNMPPEAFAAMANGSGWSALRTHDWPQMGSNNGCPPESAYAENLPTRSAEDCCPYEYFLTPASDPVTGPERHGFSRHDECSDYANMSDSILYRENVPGATVQIAWWTFPAVGQPRVSEAIVKKYSDGSWLDQWISQSSPSASINRLAMFRADSYEVYECPPFFGGSCHPQVPAASRNLHRNASHAHEAELHNRVPERNMILEVYEASKSSLGFISRKTVEIQNQLIDLALEARWELARNAAPSYRATNGSAVNRNASPINYQAFHAPIRSIESLVQFHADQVRAIPLLNDPRHELLHFERNLEITLCGTSFHGDYNRLRAAFVDYQKGKKKKKTRPKKKDPRRLATSSAPMLQPLFAAIRATTIETAESVRTARMQRFWFDTDFYLK